jgi:predicted nuclease of predicted toxin-antitoxin system
VELSTAKDSEVWNFARLREFVVITQDSDFLLGALPKIIWIATGNCSTQTIADLLRDRFAEVQAFENDPESALLILQ